MVQFTYYNYLINDTTAAYHIFKNTFLRKAYYQQRNKRIFIFIVFIKQKKNNEFATCDDSL